MNHNLKTFALFVNCFLISFQINSHGFSQDTQIRYKNLKYIALLQICEYYNDYTYRVFSYDVNTRSHSTEKVTSAARGITNCYIKFGISPNLDGDTKLIDEISCTPAQKFYNPKTKQWIPACRLKKGDQLLCNFHRKVNVTHIKLINKPLKLYSIKVNNTHTYFVGRYSVLAHNEFLAALSVGFCVSFGEGAAAGGAIGKYFGPVTFTAGLFQRCDRSYNKNHC